MKAAILGLGLCVALSQFAAPLRGSSESAALTGRIPARPAQAMTGSQFVESVRTMNSQDRERAVERELLRGNIPAFLRTLTPVTLAAQGGAPAATVFVMPDYLSIGSDEDFVRIPMNLETASDVAAKFGFTLPTRRIVNAIYAQSAYHLAPEPLPPGPQMSSTEYYRHHNDLIDAQSHERGVVNGTLVSGHKKDVVLTNRLLKTPGRIAIYGWPRLDGSTIQPLSTVHGACYEDYSHGIRLVSDEARQNGALRPVRDILQDPVASAALSDEGTIRVAAALSLHACAATKS